MPHMIERRKLLLADAENRYRELFPIRIRELEDRYRQPGTRESVREAFALPALNWNDRYSSKKAASLGICSLYSSISMRTYEYRLVLSGEEFLFDKDAIEVLWVPDSFFDGFDKDMQSVIKQLKNTYPRLCGNEEEAIRFQCVEYLHAAVYQLCADLIHEIAGQTAFIQLRKTDSFYVYFGRYRGEGEIIYRAGRNADSSIPKI